MSPIETAIAIAFGAVLVVFLAGVVWSLFHFRGPELQPPKPSPDSPPAPPMR